MEKAETALARPDATQAAQGQQQAADTLEKAARESAQANSQPAQPSPEGMPNPGQVGQARELAKRQRDLRDQVRQATAGDQSTADERAATNEKQQDMARQAGDLAKSLDQSAG